MRIAVISDTHLPRRGRMLPLRLIEECRAADLILHAGDLVGLSVLEDLELLGRVHAVCGNCDDGALARALPARSVVEAGGVRIGMIHDGGTRDGRGRRLRRLFPDADVVVFGHSHQPLIERHDDLLLVNPGSATDRRREPVCTMARMIITSPDIEVELIDLV